MRRHGPRTQIKRAIARLTHEISGLSIGGQFASGTASEGYAGGYRQALFDVKLVLDGIKPNTRDYWDDWEEAKEKMIDRKDLRITHAAIKIGERVWTGRRPMASSTIDSSSGAIAFNAGQTKELKQSLLSDHIW